MRGIMTQPPPEIINRLIKKACEGGPIKPIKGSFAKSWFLENGQWGLSYIQNGKELKIK